MRGFAGAGVVHLAGVERDAAPLGNTCLAASLGVKRRRVSEVS